MPISCSVLMKEESSSSECPRRVALKGTRLSTAQSYKAFRATRLGFPTLTCRTVDTPEIKQKHHLIGEDEMHLKEKGICIAQGSKSPGP